MTQKSVKERVVMGLLKRVSIGKKSRFLYFEKNYTDRLVVVCRHRICAKIRSEKTHPKWCFDLPHNF